MRAIVKLSHLNGKKPNPGLMIGRIRCNCCKLGGECMSPRVTTRKIGEIPGCIPYSKQQTLLETLNIDANCTDFAEQYERLGCLYRRGGYTPDGKRWVPGINYDEWWKQTWNLGKIRPIR
jgi:hypothetical protein